MTPEFHSTGEFWHRPDGTDPEVYKGLAAQGRHRLAWEWLIRTEGFRQDCQAVRIGYVDPDSVAMAWGLYRFKPFYEPYTTPRKPRFLVSKVRLFRPKRGQLVRHVSIRQGELAFVLDVDRMVLSLNSRDAQIATMTRLIDAAIERRRTRRQVTPEAKSRANDAHLDACLQLSDLLYLEVPTEAIKREVKYLRDGIAEGTVNGLFRDMKDRIEKLTRSGAYLNLAARAHSRSK